jgi:phosphoribosylaminoimidazolecarboxamide formyltransferase/IMP cyclohydrolase
LGAEHDEIIEKIDIGGIALIRAAAKNFHNVFCISNKNDYEEFNQLLNKNNGVTSLNDRKRFASKAFNTSSHYDTNIFNYFNNSETVLKISEFRNKELRYGENPHQTQVFYGKINDIIEQVNGKEISYNNLLDIDSAIQLINEFDKSSFTFAILKHNNACGLATRESLLEAYEDALSGDPISAFGGVLICNKEVDYASAKSINNLFFEVIIAPSYSLEALGVLKEKKNRIILILNTNNDLPKVSLRSCLNGYLFQDKDLVTDSINILETVTKTAPSNDEIKDLLYNKEFKTFKGGYCVNNKYKFDYN